MANHNDRKYKDKNKGINNDVDKVQGQELTRATATTTTTFRIRTS